MPPVLKIRGLWFKRSGLNGICAPNGIPGPATRSALAKFSSTRPARTDLVIAERSYCRCRRSTTCAADVRMQRVTGSSNVRLGMPSQ